MHHCSEFTSFTGTQSCVCVYAILCNVITHTDDTPHILTISQGVEMGSRHFGEKRGGEGRAQPTSWPHPHLRQALCWEQNHPASIALGDAQLVPLYQFLTKAAPSSQVWLRRFSMGNLYRTPRPHTVSPSAWILFPHEMKNSLGTESGLCVGISASHRSSSL